MKVKCIKSDPVGWVTEGEVYDARIFNKDHQTKTYLIRLKDGAFGVNEERFNEHFEFVKP